MDCWYKERLRWNPTKSSRICICSRGFVCSILQVFKEFPSMVWLSLLLLMSLSHSTLGRSEVVKVNGSIAFTCIYMDVNKFQWFFNSTDLNLLNISSEVVSMLSYEFLILDPISLSSNNTVIRCFAILPDNRSVPILETTLYVQGHEDMHEEDKNYSTEETCDTCISDDRVDTHFLTIQHYDVNPLMSCIKSFNTEAKPMESNPDHGVIICGSYQTAMKSYTPKNLVVCDVFPKYSVSNNVGTDDFSEFKDKEVSAYHEEYKNGDYMECCEDMEFERSFVTSEASKYLVRIPSTVNKEVDCENSPMIEENISKKCHENTVGELNGKFDQIPTINDHLIEFFLSAAFTLYGAVYEKWICFSLLKSSRITIC